MTETKRTDAQNRALHKYFEILANELNDGGYTVQLVMKEKMDLDWDKDKVKTLLWHPAQQAILSKKSTTELSKQENIDKVWKHLNRHIGEKFGLHIAFPDIHLVGGMCGRKGCPKCIEVAKENTPVWRQ